MNDKLNPDSNADDDYEDDIVTQRLSAPDEHQDVTREGLIISDLQVPRDPTVTGEIQVRPDISQAVKVISADQADAIRFDYEPTIMEENSFNFAATLNELGDIPVPERFKKPGGFQAGVEVIVSVSILKK